MLEVIALKTLLLPPPSPVKNFAVELDEEKKIVFCSHGEIITMQYEIEWELMKLNYVVIAAIKSMVL